MPTATMLKKPEVKLTEMQCNENVKLVQMQDLDTFDFHVQGDNHYIVHFLTPRVFGQEFATIGKGCNLLKRVKNEEARCVLLDHSEMSKVAGGAAPQTGPIIIPPTR